IPTCSGRPSCTPPANRHSPSWLRSSSARGRAGSSVKQVTTRTCGACTGNGAHRKRRRTMTDQNPDIPAAAPPPGWGEKEPEKKHTKLRRRFALGLAVFFALILIVGAIHLWEELPCGGYDNGVHSIGGQCVGITDADHIFHESYTEVQNLIAEENERVAGGHVVTVAVQGTFTFGEVSPMDPVRMQRSLEGAYTAQMRANHTHHLSDPTPQIRLVLANVGGQQEQWVKVVDDLLPMTEDPDAPLVSVTVMVVITVDTRQNA